MFLENSLFPANILRKYGSRHVASSPVTACCRGFDRTRNWLGRGGGSVPGVAAARGVPYVFFHPAKALHG